jgi:predicted PurR-regulated permease PerM
MAAPRHDLARITLAVLFIALLIGASLWILRPFLPAVVWAATLVIATWPIMRRVQERLWNSRALALTIMTLALLLVFVVPFWLAIATIVQNSGQIVGWAESVASLGLPPPPSWLGDLRWWARGRLVPGRISRISAYASCCRKPSLTPAR